MAFCADTCPPPLRRGAPHRLRVLSQATVDAARPQTTLLTSNAAFLATAVRDFKLGFLVDRAPELAYTLQANEVVGAIPEDLEGTLFRNGPGKLKIGDVTINQPFDGDGLVTQVSFRRGAAHVRTAFVRTEGFVKEEEAGKMLFKGAFSTGNPDGAWISNPFTLVLKNIANTHVVEWGGRLWALWEGGLPHELDPRTLATLEESTWDGAIPAGGAFNAHFKVIDNRLINIGVAVEGGTDARITFYEFDASAKLLSKSDVILKGAAFGFFHDWLVTPRFFILFQNPTRLNLSKLATQYIFGRAGIAECIAYDPQAPSIAHVFWRGAPDAGSFSAPLPPHFVFHHVNAFEADGGASLVCDSIAWRSVDFSSSLDTLSPAYYSTGPTSHRSELYRTVIKLPTTTASSSSSSASSASSASAPPPPAVVRTRLSPRSLEFPAVSPAVVGRAYAHAYACGSASPGEAGEWGPAQALVKLSSSTPGGLLSEAAAWLPGPRCFVQEPVFVPRRQSRDGSALQGTARDEDDGWVLLLVFDAEACRTEVAILDAKDIEAGPVARLFLRHALPFGLHGSWSDAYHGPEAAAGVGAGA